MLRLPVAAAAALILVGCAHPAEIRNLDSYRSPAPREALERQTTIGVITSAPDGESLRLVRAVGAALEKHSARVVQPYKPGTAGVEVVARISATPRYRGAGSNWFVNIPGLLVLAPTWNGYAYTIDYTFQVLLTRAWDNAKIDSWTVPVSLDVRHSSGMLLSSDYNPEVTTPAVDLALEPVADHLARDIARRLNSEGRLWKLEPPIDWVVPAAPVPPVPPVRATAPAPAASAPPVPAVAPSPVTPAPAASGAPLAKGGAATLKAGARVLTRPRPEGTPVVIAPGSVVKLGPNLRNDGGSWWYVSAEGKSGWVREADLAAGP
jgi:hypothetical protein